MFPSSRTVYPSYPHLRSLDGSAGTDRAPLVASSSIRGALQRYFPDLAPDGVAEDSIGQHRGEQLGAGNRRRLARVGGKDEFQGEAIGIVAMGPMQPRDRHVAGSDPL